MPVVRAILLADQIYQDTLTGKFVIAGTFDQISVTAFPGDHSSTSLYLNLGDFHGSHELLVRLVRLEDGIETDLVCIEGIEQEVRARTLEFHVPLPPMSFDRAGSYSIEVVWDGNLLGECRIQVALTEVPTME